MIGTLKVFLNKLKANLAAEVSADNAACEFDCRELDCSNQDWETCPNRLQTKHSIEHSMWQASGFGKKRG